MNTKRKFSRGEHVTVFEKNEWSVVRYEGFGRTSNGPNWSVYYMSQFVIACTTKKRCIDYINRQTAV
jgi:hypothetical protein